MVLIFETSLGVIIFRYFQLKKEILEFEKISREKVHSKQELVDLTLELEDCLLKRKLEFLFDTSTTEASLNKIPKIGQFLSSHFKNRGKGVRFSIGTLVLIGLLGTFIGLISSVQSLEYIFTSNAISNVEENQEIISLLADSFGGISLAFGTSICGIVSSIILGFLYNFYSLTALNYSTEVEQVAEIKIKPHLFKVRYDFIASIFAESFNKVVADTLIGGQKKLIETVIHLESITRDIKTSINEYIPIITSLKTSAKNIEETSFNLNKSIENVLARNYSLLKIEEQIQNNLQNFKLLIQEGVKAIATTREYLEKVAQSYLIKLESILAIQTKEQNIIISEFKTNFAYINDLLEDEKKNKSLLKTSLENLNESNDSINIFTQKFELYLKKLNENLSFLQILENIYLELQNSVQKFSPIAKDQISKLERALENFDGFGQSMLSNLQQIAENSYTSNKLDHEFTEYQKKVIADTGEVVKHFSNNLESLVKLIEHRVKKYLTTGENITIRFEKLLPYIKKLEYQLSNQRTMIKNKKQSIEDAYRKSTDGESGTTDEIKENKIEENRFKRAIKDITKFRFFKKNRIR